MLRKNRRAPLCAIFAPGCPTDCALGSRQALTKRIIAALSALPARRAWAGTARLLGEAQLCRTKQLPSPQKSCRRQRTSSANVFVRIRLGRLIKGMRWIQEPLCLSSAMPGWICISTAVLSCNERQHRGSLDGQEADDSHAHSGPCFKSIHELQRSLWDDALMEEPQLMGNPMRAVA